MDIVDFDEGRFVENDLYSGEHKSVLYAVNKIVVIHAAREAELTQEDGKDKAEVAFSIDGESEVMVFFTGSVNLRKILFSGNISFPFRTCLKVVKTGSFMSLKFCNPASRVTDEDAKNLELFIMKQDRRFVSRM
jgi:hypothetical protein